jgi:hypothetical protein
MKKTELLKNAIEQGNEYEGISWDGMLDLCDEDVKLVHWLNTTLEKMKENNEISFDLW